MFSTFASAISLNKLSNSQAKSDFLRAATLLLPKIDEKIDKKTIFELTKITQSLITKKITNLLYELNSTV